MGKQTESSRLTHIDAIRLSDLLKLWQVDGNLTGKTFEQVARDAGDALGIKLSTYSLKRLVEGLHLDWERPFARRNDADDIGAAFGEVRRRFEELERRVAILERRQHAKDGQGGLI